MCPTYRNSILVFLIMTEEGYRRMASALEALFRNAVVGHIDESDLTTCPMQRLPNRDRI